MLKIEKSKRIKDLPPYLFARIDQIKAEQIAKGVDVIDLTIGDPDLPTPEGIIRQMNQSLENAKNHRYPPYAGILPLRQAVAEWYWNRFQVKLNPETEVLILIGSKEGIAHIPLAFFSLNSLGNLLRKVSIGFSRVNSGYVDRYFAKACGVAKRFTHSFVHHSGS